MAAILITCPTTSTPFVTGQHASPGVFQESEAYEGGRFRCTACGQVHEWKREEAWLQPGALARADLASYGEVPEVG